MVNKNLNNTKAQVWFTDFVIGMIIFSLVLISYYTYTTNISKQDSSATDNLISDAKIVSSSLTTKGYPDNWDVNTVTRIGFTDSYNRIDTTKFNEFNKLNYNDTKKLLGTIYDYFLFFVNESDDVQNVEGFCGTGLGLVNISYEISAAYYNECPNPLSLDPPPCEIFMKSFMEEEFTADYFYDKNKGATVGINDQSALRDRINDYDFIVVEHPTWSSSDFSAFVAVADPWVLGGGILFVGGQMGSSASSTGFGVTFKKKTGQAIKDRLSTVVNEDEFVDFNLADNIIFRQAYYIEDSGLPSGFKDIARFNCSTSPSTCYDEFDDIKANGDIALARWPWGTDDGKILFFSDFDATYLAGNFQDILEGSALKWANAVCLPINISNIKRDNLIRTDRLVIYNSDQIKMVLYLWD